MTTFPPKPSGAGFSLNSVPWIAAPKPIDGFFAPDFHFICTSIAVCFVRIRHVAADPHVDHLDRGTAGSCGSPFTRSCI